MDTDTGACSGRWDWSGGESIRGKGKICNTLKNNKNNITQEQLDGTDVKGKL